MMYRVGILLCTIAVGLHIVAGANDILPDTITYSCVPSSQGINVANYQIKIERKDKLPSIFNGIYAFQQNNSAHKECISTNETNWFVIQGCWNVNVTVVISKIGSLIGGEGSKVYTLKCVGPYNGSNVMISVSKAIEYSGLTNVHVQNTSYAVSFNMEITDMTNIPKSNFLLGEQMQLKITPNTSLSDLHWNVMKCTAHSGADFDLYDGKSFSTLSYIAVTGNNYSAGSQDKFAATLYAFHGKDENKVTYECNIAVCRGANTANTCTISRRRRSLENSHVVTKTIYVLDQFDKTEQSKDSGSLPNKGSPFVKILVCVFGLMFCLLM